MKNSYRIWCENNQEWEKDQCVLSPNGNLMAYNSFGRGEFQPMRADTHIVEFSTGLKDKKRTEEYPNGQGIYAGDIIRLLETHTTLQGKTLLQQEDFIGVIEWDEEGADYNVVGLNGNLRGFGVTGQEYEVIGNIHQNKDLLEG